MKKLILLITFSLLLSISSAAWAYIGPGAAIGLLGYVLGFSSAMVVGVIFVIAWPVWIIYKRMKNKKALEDDTKAEKTKNDDDAEPRQ